MTCAPVQVMAVKARVALCALMSWMALASFAAPPQCRLVKVAEWPVRLERGQPLIDGAINGKKVAIMLDTGAYASMLTNAAAERLGLFTYGTSQFTTGFGGDSRVRQTRLEELRIGDAVLKAFIVRVAGERSERGYDFILGDDFFEQMDVELDYSMRVIRLFQPRDCKGAFLGYWDPKALELPMDDGSKVVVRVALNGKPSWAVLDTGASSSVVLRSLAERAGVAPGSPGVRAAGCSTGVGASLVRSWVGTFDRVQIGGEAVRNARIYIADHWPQHGVDDRNEPWEMLLGADFLRTHRVLVARSQRKVYFSHVGGQVFSAAPWFECDERMAGKKPEELLAAAEAALAKDPADTTALLQRARLRLLQKDGQGALADAQAALRAQPDDPLALNLRSQARANLGDHDGALADADAAIANGMRVASMYMHRARVRRAQGDPAGAVEEYGEALKLEPGHIGALQRRGMLLYRLGRFDAAARDFQALTEMRRNAYDAIWLSLALGRGGADGRPPLEQAAARLRRDAWPAPVLAHLLGRLDAEGLMAAAAVADGKKRRERECDARFYRAMKLLAEGSREPALPLLAKARDECPATFIEREAAQFELGKL